MKLSALSGKSVDFPTKGSTERCSVGKSVVSRYEESKDLSDAALSIESDLLLTEVEILHQAKRLVLNRILVDTGSGTTVFSRSRLKEVGILLHIEDQPQRIRGIGGTEIVFQKQFDTVGCGEFIQHKFKAQLGFMKYGVDIDGILGLDFLTSIGAILDLKNLEIRSAF